MFDRKRKKEVYPLEISFFKLACLIGWEYFRSYFKKPNQNFICLKIPGPDMKEGKHGGRPLCSYLEPQNTKGSVTSDVELDGPEFFDYNFS